jgi:5-methylcytosine-specific restriction endonuclease McrA
LTEFYANKRMTDGRASWCKTCTKAGALAAYHAAPAKHNARRKANKAAKPELHRAVHARWAAANPEAMRESWRKTKQTRRAARKGILSEYVDPLVLLEMDDGVCGICGSDVDPFEFHMDHVVPVSRGGDHSYANMQVAHPSCNKGKGATLPWDYQTDGSYPSGSPHGGLEAQASCAGNL